MQLTKNKKISHIALATLLATGSLLSVGLSQRVHAAALAQTTVRFDRMQISTPTSGMVCAKPTTSSTDVKSWNVTFPTGYTVSTTAANWQTANISTTNLPSGASAWPNATSATASVTGQVVTWTNSAAQTMNSGTLYCYNWTSTAAISQPSSAGASELGSITTFNSSSTQIDSGQYATATIANDQIVVTATVPPTFSFSLSGNTDPIGTLTAGSPKSGTTPQTVTINTNAKNGWMMWAKDSNTGLASATASKTIASTTPGTVSTLTGAAEGYNTGAAYTVTTGTVTIDPAFASSGTPYKGGGLDTTNRLVATGGGVTNNAVVTLTNNVNVLASTPAATDYTDTITVVGAGLF